MNRTNLKQTGFWKPGLPSLDFWNKVVLEQSSKIEETGEPVWHLIAVMLGTYLIVYILTIKGVKIAAKAVYFTALFPYFVLLVLGIRGWSLPGSEIGIKFFCEPKWEKFFDIGVWMDAGNAIFFSISISFGGMTTLASYNRFNANIMRDAISIPLATCCTSFLGGFVIFTYMGYLSQVMGQNIEDIITAGQGLAFVVYPYAVTTIAISPLWSMLFFLMLILLGLSSQVSNIQVTVTSVLDQFPSLKKTSRLKYITTTAVFTLYALTGFIFCFKSGSFWIEIFNTYTGDWSILIVGACECIYICYFYGIQNVRKDIQAMLGPRYSHLAVFLPWALLWCILCPILSIVIAGIAIKATQLGLAIRLGDYIFPQWTFVMGQVMNITIVLGILLYAIYVLVKGVFIEKKSVSSLIFADFDEYVPKEICDQIKIQELRKNKPTFYGLTSLKDIDPETTKIIFQQTK